MRLAFASVLLASVLCACADDGDEDTGADDTSTTLPVTTAPMDSSSDGGTTGATFECDANIEIALADGVGLGAQSVEAVRLEAAGDVQYTVTIVGDPVDSTQLDIVFYGLPAAGMEYTAAAVMQIGLPRVELMPDPILDFIGGTVTYTLVGTAEGDALALDFDLEFMRGTIAGCVQTELAIETQ